MTNLEHGRKQDADYLRRNAVKTGNASNWRCTQQFPPKIWRLCTPFYPKYTRSTFVRKVSTCPRDWGSTLTPRRWYVIFYFSSMQLKQHVALKRCYVPTKLEKVIFINNFLASDFGGNALRLKTSQASLPRSQKMLTFKWVWWDSRWQVRRTDKSQNEASGRKDDAKTGKLKNHNSSLQDSEGKWALRDLDMKVTLKTVFWNLKS